MNDLDLNNPTILAGLVDSVLQRSQDKPLTKSEIVDKVIRTWPGTQMQAAYDALNSMIDGHRAVEYKPGKFVYPYAVKHLQAMEKHLASGPNKTRAEYDRLTPQEQMDFASKGGVIV
jgi:hypothetical protein